MFANSIFPTGALTSFIASVKGTLVDNIGVILGCFAFIVGMSIILAIFDTVMEGRRLDAYAKRWRK